MTVDTEFVEAADKNHRGSYWCAVCHEAINIAHGNYRIVGVTVSAEWYKDERGDPPTCVYKHRHCMDVGEWLSE